MSNQSIGLGAFLRQDARLAPETSLASALRQLRERGLPEAHVVSASGDLLGSVSIQDLAVALEEPTAPVTRVMRPAALIARPEQGVGEICRSMSQRRVASAPVTDSDGSFLGSIVLFDVAGPLTAAPSLAGIGGMATPWGVYLTNGAVRAGAGPIALVAGGATMGAALGVAHLLCGGLAAALEPVTPWRLVAIWNSVSPVGDAAERLLWYILQFLALPLFLAILRLLPLAGYHAAEHQAVHALERGEPLRVEVLRRMPRVHPRCGTNLIAGMMVFALVAHGVQASGLLGGLEAAVVGAVAAVSTWRRLGGFLQTWFTTRPASDRQLAAGIDAAEALVVALSGAVSRRPRAWQRVWNLGVLQTAAGVSAGLMLVTKLALLLFPGLG
jgi:CBS domain-containing protein